MIAIKGEYKMEWEKAYKSLLGCMIGTLSNLDLLYTRQQLDTLYSEDLQNYYMVSVEAHCEMGIFDDPINA